MSILGNCIQVVLVSEFLGEQIKVHLHVFKAIEGSLQIETFDVSSHVFSTFSADDAVPHQFGCCQVGRTGC